MRMGEQYNPLLAFEATVKKMDGRVDPVGGWAGVRVCGRFIRCQTTFPCVILSVCVCVCVSLSLSLYVCVCVYLCV